MSLRRPVLVAAAVLTLLGAAGCSSDSADSVLELQVGDCANQSDLQGDQIESVPTVECSEEHDAEIFAEHVFTDEEFPGDDAVQAKSEDVCTAKFEEFIGVPFMESQIQMTMLRPSQDSWENGDDRTTLCVVLSEEPMTGSLEGAGV